MATSTAYTATPTYTNSDPTGGSYVDNSGGASGSDGNAWALSKGAIVAISVVVGVVAAFGSEFKKPVLHRSRNRHAVEWWKKNMLIVFSCFDHPVVYRQEAELGGPKEYHPLLKATDGKE